MDKFKPTYNLEKFKNSDYYVTKTAKNSAFNLGFDIEGIHEVISTMESRHFYKSMTSYQNHRIWQDVYHVPYGNLVLYIKFTQEVVDEFSLLSFKEK